MALEHDANDAHELPDRLLFLSGHYEGWSLRLDLGPVYIGDKDESTVRLNPHAFEGVQVIICPSPADGGAKRFELINQGNRAIINDKVRTFRSRLAHGDTVAIPSDNPDVAPVRFRVAAAGRDDEDEVA
jgi:hypothetical protein